METLGPNIHQENSRTRMRVFSAGLQPEWTGVNWEAGQPRRKAPAVGCNSRETRRCWRAPSPQLTLVLNYISTVILKGGWVLGQMQNIWRTNPPWLLRLVRAEGQLDTWIMTVPAASRSHHHHHTGEPPNACGIQPHDGRPAAVALQWTRGGGKPPAGAGAP